MHNVWLSGGPKQPIPRSYTRKRTACLHLDFVHVQDATRKHACAPVQLACHAMRVREAHEIVSFFSFPCFFSLVA